MIATDIKCCYWDNEIRIYLSSSNEIEVIEKIMTKKKGVAEALKRTGK